MELEKRTHHALRHTSYPPSYPGVALCPVIFFRGGEREKVLEFIFMHGLARSNPDQALSGFLEYGT